MKKRVWLFASILLLLTGVAIANLTGHTEALLDALLIELDPDYDGSVADTDLAVGSLTIGGSNALTVADVDDTPVNGVTAAPVSSNWAYDHAAAADPHAGYMLESNIGTGAGNYVVLDGSARLPAVDGSQLTGLAGGGDITGVTAGTGMSGGGASGDVTLNIANTAVTPGSYTNADITVDQQGRITAASNGSAGTGDVTAASAFGTDNRLIRSDGTGKGVQGSAITVDDSGNMSGVGTISAGATGFSVDADGDVTGKSFSVPATTAGPQLGYYLEDSDNGSNYVGIGSPAANANDLIFLLPTSDPAAGQAMVWAVPSSVTFADGVARDASQATYITPYSAGGTDVAVTDGGTGRSTGATAYGLIAAGTTATGAQQTLAAGATTEILVGGGASALPVWTTATGTGAPVRATSPTLVTPALGTPSSGVTTNMTLNVGNADTTLTRTSAGVVAVEGVTMPRIIASGAATFNPSSVSDGACSSAVDGGTATGVLTTDVITWTVSADPTSTTGYNPSGDLGYIWAYPTADHVNFKFCNKSGSAIDPGSITINWKVFR